MHEMSIATALMTQLEAVAVQERAVRIVEVTVVCGAMQQVVPEALDLAFEAVIEGTIAEGAALTIEEEELSARCRTCGHAYRPTVEDFLCSKCQSADAELTSGNDIVLKSVICEREDEAVDA